MYKFEIIVEEDVFVTSNTSIVDTKFFIRYDSKCFPFDNWTDYTFPILEEWKYNLLRIKDVNNVSTILYFHDGPFWLEVYKNDKMELKIDCINDRKERCSEMTIYCNFYDFLTRVYEALKIFIKILYKNGMNIGDFSSVYEQSIQSQIEIRSILKLI